jgi:hypothetical protein
LFQSAELKRKNKLKHLLAHATLYINRRPTIRRIALSVLAKHPTLKRRLRLMSTSEIFAQVFQSHITKKPTDLTPRARLIYENLKSTIEKKNKDKS